MKNKFHILNRLTILFVAMSIAACSSSKDSKNMLELSSFDTYPEYKGKDLGLTYKKGIAVFKVWSPVADSIRLRLYNTDMGGEPIGVFDLKQSVEDKNGLWMIALVQELKGVFYTYQAKIDGTWKNEVVDPYAKAVGRNGDRAAVIDLADTNPEGWELDLKPDLKSPTDMIIYELHIRDFSSSENSGIENKGKYLAFTEKGTVGLKGMKTGIDHLTEMGITHLHLLPAFDFASIDETKLDVPQFNWGYDPKNYNVPEGSYATDPADPIVRIKEFKQMVQALHQKGIRVVMDVVYNHTGPTDNSNFNQLVPGYYYRQNKEGGFSNASGCGNETASDRPMMRKFIMESVKYWADEYHIDGFRFDLMAIHDRETMNQITEEVKAMDSTIFFYGEGWTAGGSPLADEDKALKGNIKSMPHVAAFSDDIRDGIKGHYSDHTSKGFVSGNSGLKNDVQFGIVAAGNHHQIKYDSLDKSKAAWTNAPTQCINYVSCHDNHTLLDKLMIANPEASEKTIIDMHKLANTIVLTSQGIPFLHAGVEMLRTKFGEENSYNKPDSINQINWDLKYQNRKVVDYYQTLIALRKAHPMFRLNTAQEIEKRLTFLESDSNIVAYSIDGQQLKGETWKQAVVVFNGSQQKTLVNIPEGKWNIALINGVIKPSGLGKINSGKLRVEPYSATILFQ